MNGVQPYWVTKMNLDRSHTRITAVHLDEGVAAERYKCNVIPDCVSSDHFGNEGSDL